MKNSSTYGETYEQIIQELQVSCLFCVEGLNYGKTYSKSINFALPLTCGLNNLSQ